jgi:hypothetical protein
MDPLSEELMKRALAQQSVPSVPPNPDPKMPTEMQRYQHAQQLQQAYRNGWYPNPVLLQASQK